MQMFLIYASNPNINKSAKFIVMAGFQPPNRCRDLIYGLADLLTRNEAKARREKA